MAALGTRLNLSRLGKPTGRAQETLGKVGLGGFDHQMKMVGHQTIRMHLPAGFLSGLAERLQKPPPIFIVLEDRLAPVSPVHEVIDRSRILHSQFARHASEALRPGLRVKHFLQ